MKLAVQRAAGVPWTTLVVASLAVGLWLSPGGHEALVYERVRVIGGEWWRLVTGHWVHWSGGHLGWNLAVLVPLGVWVERLAPARTRWFFAITPGVIGLVLLVGDGALARYAGLSGIAAGVLTLLALTKLSSGASDRWFWRVALALLGLKIAVELVLGEALLARFGETPAQPVPLAHLAGAGCAVGVYWIRRR